MVNKEASEMIRKEMEAYSGRKIEDIQMMPEEEAEWKAQWQETAKLLQKKQEERRRMKEEDLEGYRKMREAEWERMRNDPDDYGSEVWIDVPAEDNKDKPQD